jgi:uncharacterized protein
VALAAAGAILLATAAGGKPSPYPSFTSALVDTVHVVPDDVAAQVEAGLRDYQARSGNQVAVAIVHTTGNQALETYSIGLARQWGVGTKDKDNGVLLLIAYDDHKIRIEVGRHLEGTLTDLQSGRIINDRMVPLLRDNNPGGAVLQGTEAIRQVLGDTKVGPLPVVPASKPTSQQTPGWVFPVVILFIILAGFVSRFGRRRRWFGGFGGPIFWGGGFGGGFGGGSSGGGGGFGGGGFGGGGGGGFGGGGASGGW